MDRDRLLEQLVRAAPERAPDVLSRGDQIAAALQAALVSARTTWPDLVVSDDAFVHAVAPGVAEAADLAAAIGELATDDIYLTTACATGARAALDAFASRCDPVVTGCLRGFGLGPDAIDEIAQELRTKLFVAVDGPPKIASYSGRAALTSWVRIIATRAAIDRARSSPPTSDDSVLERVPDSGDSPDLAYFRDIYRDEFKQSFEEALGSLEVRERNLLRQHFVDRLTLDEIGALYGVHKTTAMRWLESARLVLSKRTRASFHRRIQVVPEELDSIMRLLHSQIDLSLSRLL